MRPTGAPSHGLLDRRVARDRRGISSCCALGALTVTRLGTEFLPELDEGDIQLFVEMPPSIALEKGQDILLEVRRRILAFPEVRKTHERAGPPGGRHRQRRRQHERDVHSPEAGARVAPGLRQEAPDRRDARLADRNPGRALQLLAADEGQRRGGRQRRARQGGAEGVRHRSRADARPPWSRPRRRSRTCRASWTSTSTATSSTPQLQVRFDRQALARAGIAMEDAQRTLETALAGRVVDHHVGRRAPGAGAADAAARDPRRRRRRSARSRSPPSPAPASRCAISPTSRSRTASHRSTGKATAAISRLKFNIEGRDMGSVVNDAIATVGRSVQAARRPLLRLGRRVREPAARDRPAQAGRAAGGADRARPALCGDEFRAQRPRHPADRPVRAHRRHFCAARGRRAALGERGGGLHRAARPGVADGGAGAERGRGAAAQRRGAAAGADRGRGRAAAARC